MCRRDIAPTYAKYSAVLVLAHLARPSLPRSSVPRSTADNKRAYGPIVQYEVFALRSRATTSALVVYVARVTETVKYQTNGGSHVSGRRGRWGGASRRREETARASGAGQPCERAA